MAQTKGLGISIGGEGPLSVPLNATRVDAEAPPGTSVVQQSQTRSEARLRVEDGLSVSGEFDIVRRPASSMSAKFPA